MFCVRKGAKPAKEYRPPTSCSLDSQDEGLTDNNASFLRAARAGNVEKVLEFLKGNIDINISNANGLNALHLASKEGHVNVVTELLKKGANVNAATKKGNTALHIASLAGQYEVAKVLVNLGANVNVQSQNGFTPLYMAAQENHDNVVSFLLANGANQSLATEDGFTPLAVALQQGHDKVVAVLLENDTKGKVRLPALHIAAKKDDCKAATLLLQNDHNPDVTSKSGFTPLHIAAHYGNENIAHILLEKGADVNYAAKHQITPLHVASKWGKSNMVTLLLDKGAKIEASTRDGLTPLHCAARSGHDQVVDLLLERGAPILAKTKNGLAPLHMASQGDHVDSARILLYHKAPVDDVTVDYLTALHVAAHCGHVKVAKLLLDRKADPNARALNGFTPLHIACKKNRIKVVELLLKHGASIEATTESGLTPLHVASFMGCMNIVIYLIQNGANPDVPTVRGETPLHLAARANQTDIIRILLRNGANVDARAREEQTPLHIAARLGNVDIVSLLLQHGAAVDATTKDMYTALHIAAKEDQEEVASVLLDHGASLTSTTKKGFTPLHLAAKYGNIKVARLLLQKDAPVDAQGKNGVTPLHVASHYDHVNVALLLLDKGASPHAMAKNGYTPLHIAAKKNQMDIATTLLEYGAKANSESKAGFTPLHLASQDGHTDITTLLIEHQADVNFKANNGLTPLHLCAQEDRVNVASVLVKNGADVGPQTKAGYTPLHVASHFGQINMVRFLLQQNADVHMITSHGYTPLHQAAQQGHTLVVNLLLENEASPNVTTSQGQTALSIAQRLGYISVVETLKVVTETTVTTTTTTVTEEKYKVVAPETMQETFMTDSEDEGGEDVMLGDQSYRYLTADEMKSLGDDSLPIDVTKDEKQHEAVHSIKESPAPMVEEDHISPQHITPVEVGFSEKYSPDNVDLSRAPIHAGFLVSFMVDARGGAMRGCRHSGVRVIIPPRKASMPMRITCRYLRKEKLIHPPPLMEGEACASRILEVGPIGARFLGPVIIEVPHFAALRGKEREITILRSDTGENWREHTLQASEGAVLEVINESFEGDELSALEDLNTNRITRILTTDFPQYFAIVTRIRQEAHGVGPEGGMVSSTVVPQVQAIFAEGALTKKIRVGLQAQPIAPELVAKLLGNRVAVSPIVTVEPRRRKFHKSITLTIPVPQAATKGMINQYSGDAPTLRLLCSITGSTKSGGSSKAQWEDVTGSTPLTFVNDCVSFTTTVSARFWLMDCRQVNEASRFATELYQEAVHVPFMSKFVIFAKRTEPNEAHLRVFCMTDDKEDKTLETQENFTEIAKSRDVEVLEGKMQYLEFAGNLVPVTKSGEQLKFSFQAFHENRLAFTIRVKDPHVEPMGRIAFMKEPKVGRGEPPQVPICNLNVALPEVVVCDSVPVALELVTLEKRDDFTEESGLSKPESIHRADLRLSDIARELDKDWVSLAQQLEISESDINIAKSEYPDDVSEQALTMLRLWLQKAGSRATGNELEKGLRKISREDIIKKCMFNVELVTDDVEKAVAKVHLDQSGFDVFKEELGSSREASMRRGASLDISYDEQDIMKDAESAAETSSETGSIFERDQISQVFSDEKDRFIEEARIRRVSKTPPPSPAEVISKDFVEEKSSAEENVVAVESEILEKSDVVHEEEAPTPAPKPTETVDEMMKPMVEVPETTAKQTESETWPSGEMDTSQVSVSSLPDDEKSETTTATVSSATAADGDKETKVEEVKEWTETDESGAIKHVIQKTTHMTLSMQQKSDDLPDEEASSKPDVAEQQISEESGNLMHSGQPGEEKSLIVDEDKQADHRRIFYPETLEQNAIIQAGNTDVIIPEPNFFKVVELQVTKSPEDRAEKRDHVQSNMESFSETSAGPSFDEKQNINFKSNGEIGQAFEEPTRFEMQGLTYLDYSPQVSSKNYTDSHVTTMAFASAGDESSTVLENINDGLKASYFEKSVLQQETIKSMIPESRTEMVPETGHETFEVLKDDEIQVSSIPQEGTGLLAELSHKPTEDLGLRKPGESIVCDQGIKFVAEPEYSTEKIKPRDIGSYTISKNATDEYVLYDMPELGPESAAICQTSMPSEGLGIQYAAENPEHIEPCLEVERRTLINSVDTRKNETAEQIFGSFPELEKMSCPDVCEFDARAPHLYIQENMKYQEINEPKITEEKSEFPEMSKYQYECQDLKIDENIMSSLPSQRMEPGSQYIHHNTGVEAMDINYKYSEPFGFYDDKNQQSVSDIRPDASEGSWESSVTALRSEFVPSNTHEITEIPLEFETSNIVLLSKIVSEDRTEECPEVASSDLEIPRFDIDHKNEPSLNSYSRGNISTEGILQSEEKLPTWGENKYSENIEEQDCNVYSKLKTGISVIPKPTDDFAVYSTEGTESSSLTYNPVHDTYSYPEMEPLDQTHCSYVQSGDYESEQATDDTFMVCDIQNTGSNADNQSKVSGHYLPEIRSLKQSETYFEPDFTSLYQDQMMFREESSKDMKGHNNWSSIAQKERSDVGPMDELVLTGTKFHSKGMDLVPEQNEMSSDFESLSAFRSRFEGIPEGMYTTQHEENWDEDVEIPNFMLPDYNQQQDAEVQGETSESQSFETVVETQPGSVATRRIVTTTTTVHHTPEDVKAFPSSTAVSGESTDSRQGAQDDSYHLSSEYSSSHVDDH